MYWKKGVIILDILRGHVQFSIEEKIGYAQFEFLKKSDIKKQSFFLLTVKQRVQS